MVDFVRLLATAQRLITANGRSVTFIRHDQTDPDAAKPWEAPVDPRATPDATLVVDVVQVNLADATKLGMTTEQSDLFTKSEKILIVAAGATDLLQFQEVLDDSTYWKITTIETLQPGSTIVLSFVGIRR